jgi:hypothetical protein
MLVDTTVVALYKLSFYFPATFNVSSDTIVQRAKEIDNGILQTTFSHGPTFCKQLFNNPRIHHLLVGFAFYNDQFVLQKNNRIQTSCWMQYPQHLRNTQKTINKGGTKA